MKLVLDKETVIKIVATAAISTLTGFLVMELLKRMLKRDDVQVRPLPLTPTALPGLKGLHGMPGHEMASEHWRRY